MSEQTIRRINVTSFYISLAAIIVGVVIGVMGVWDVIPRDMLWRLLLSVGIVFGGSVLTNLAVQCYRAPG